MSLAARQNSTQVDLFNKKKLAAAHSKLAKAALELVELRQREMELISACSDLSDELHLSKKENENLYHVIDSLENKIHKLKVVPFVKQKTDPTVARKNARKRRERN
jgi:hypothetical protein